MSGFLSGCDTALSWPLAVSHFSFFSENKNPDRGIKSDLKMSVIFLFFENLMEISLVIFFFTEWGFLFPGIKDFYPWI